ncbi:MAG: hypothetical protein QN819_06385 [Nitrososphaeraceae archaeon]|nr:hypothetical protein [Nitrososphaeraceae archaeon]
MKKIWLFIPLVLIALIIGILNIAIAAERTSSINWSKICISPLVDNLVAEPCHSLTSPNGTALTDTGRKILVCLMLGGLSKSFGIPEEQLKLLLPSSGCTGFSPQLPTQP